MKLAEFEQKRLELAILVGEQKAMEWFLLQKAVLNYGDLIDREEKALITLIVGDSNFGSNPNLVINRGT